MGGGRGHSNRVMFKVKILGCYRGPLIMKHDSRTSMLNVMMTILPCHVPSLLFASWCDVLQPDAAECWSTTLNLRLLQIWLFLPLGHKWLYNNKVLSTGISQSLLYTVAFSCCRIIRQLFQANVFHCTRSVEFSFCFCFMSILNSATSTS